ncbi:hypothetical protein ACFCWG_41505 [Streptomyces sp. NPDC056390]|uniref:hypothetical protein n=1 Tax=Streptomyces sp. NPDC056390 TaxID=3345806 RepID=UPI0035DF1C44
MSVERRLRVGDGSRRAVRLAVLGPVRAWRGGTPLPLEEAEGNPETAIALHHRALLLQRRLMSPLTEPHYDRLGMDIRNRLGSADAAAGRLREASREFQAVLDLPGVPRAAHRMPRPRVTRPVAGPAIPSPYAASPTAGSMFWLAWNRLFGSYLRLTSARRS